MKRPSVSVIIPTKNRLKLLKQAVASVLEQSIDDYELIITDNCSTDGTEAWVKKQILKNPKVRYFRNSDDLGMVGNWNAGLDHARGKYITLLMDDDLWDKTFLQSTAGVLETHKRVGFVAVWVKAFAMKPLDDNTDYPSDFYKLYPSSCEVSGISCIEQYLTNSWLVGLPSGILFRKSVLDQVGVFDPLGLDPDLWLRFCAVSDFYYIDKPLCHFRAQSSGSFTSSNKIGTIEFQRQFAILDHLNILKLPRLREILPLAYRRCRCRLIEAYFSTHQFTMNEGWNLFHKYGSFKQLVFDLLYLGKLKFYLTWKNLRKNDYY